MDAETVRATMRKWLRTNFFYSYFETHYRDIPPRILAEQLMLTAQGERPDGYGFYTFNGHVRVITHLQDYDQPSMSITRYDATWRRLVVRSSRPALDYDTPPPKRLARMIEVAETLAAGFDFVRVDLYCFDDEVKFSEMTHTPDSGLRTPTPRDFDDYLGRLWGGAIEPMPERYYAKNSGRTAGKIAPLPGVVSR
jgi:hypothetical protein